MPLPPPLFTVPVIEKLNGFSLPSLLLKLICPLFVPGLVVSAAPGKCRSCRRNRAREPPTRQNPAGKVSPEVSASSRHRCAP